MALHVVLGASGPVGMGVAKFLQEQGKQVRTVSRRAKIDGLVLSHVSADVTVTQQCIEACKGASVIYNCVGVEYNGKMFMEKYPKIVKSAIAAAAASGAVLVNASDLYCYEPEALRTAEKVTTKLPLISPNRSARYPKACAMSIVEKLAEEAHRSGRCTTVNVLASDLYGPNVTTAQLGEMFFPPLCSGKPAQLVVNGKTRHSYTYVEDFSRALVVAGSNERAWNRTWHVPSSRAVTALEVARLAAGSDARVKVMSPVLRAVLSRFVPIVAEINEVNYQFERDFVVGSDFDREFPEFGGAMSIEKGVKATMEWYSKQ